LPLPSLILPSEIVAIANFRRAVTLIAPRAYELSTSGAEKVNYIAVAQNALKISVFANGLASRKSIYWKPQTKGFP
jgi:hypothetical protein